MSKKMLACASPDDQPDALVITRFIFTRRKVQIFRHLRLIGLLGWLLGASILSADGLVYYLVDRSDSMSSKQLVEPVKKAIATHAAGLSQDTTVYLQFFWGQAGELYRWADFSSSERAQFKQAIDREFVPIGRTRLFDTVAESVARLRSVANRHDQITFIIFSDGDDNLSSQRSKSLRWSLITPELLKLADANEYARTYLIALPGQNPTAEDFVQFRTKDKNGKDVIIHTEILPEQEVIIPVLAPEVSLSAVPTKAEPLEDIQFIARNSGGDASQYLWDFGDGNSKKGRISETHSYRAEGVYDVSVRAIGDGGEDVAERKGYIQIAYAIPLEAVISVFPEKPVSGQPILFNSASTGSPDKLEWLLNGTLISTAPSHTWKTPAPGTHKVELRIHKGSRSDSAIQTIEVAPPPPSAKFEFPDGNEYDFGAKVRGVALASGNDLTYSWTVGGAERFEGSQIEWTSDREGLIEFVLRVENSRGAISVASDKILVRKPEVVLPDAGFSAEPLPAEMNATLKLTAKSVDSSLSHEWYIDGEPVGTGSVVRYIPEKEGTLAIRHVLRQGEFTKENSSEIFVKEPELAVARFKVSDKSGTLPLEVEFKDNSEGKIVAYVWDFGDGNDSNEANPSHTYSQAGEYRVNLTVTNSAGAETTGAEPVTITVKDPLPGWIKWAVIGVIAVIILLILWIKFKPGVLSGRLRYNYEDHAKVVELEGTQFDLKSLNIPGWKPKSNYTIVNKGGEKLLRNGAVLEELDGRRKQFKLDGAEFTYLP